MKPRLLLVHEKRVWDPDKLDVVCPHHELLEPVLNHKRKIYNTLRMVKMKECNISNSEHLYNTITLHKHSKSLQVKSSFHQARIFLLK